MNTIILSALGTGAYREARYQSEHHAEPVTTGLFAVALHRWHPQAEVKLLATDMAWKSANGDYVREHHPDFERVRIPEGRTEAEAWELFGAMTDAVPLGSRVIFDITHGLRSLPMLGFLALSYLRVVRNVTIERVYYGALELTPREEGALTPVVDLTPLVGLLDWAQAAKRFQDTGDASLFKPLLEMKRTADYNAVSRQLEVLSLNLAGNRGPCIPDEAQKLLRVLETARRGSLEAHQQPFALVMDQLEGQVRPLAAPADDPKLRLQAEYALMRWYAGRGHYPQAMSLAREWLISVRQWHELGRVSMNEEERERINDDGKAAMKALQDGSREALEALPVHLQTFTRLNATVNRLRNDLMHFGFKEELTGARQIAQKVTAALDALPDAVRPLGLDLEDAALERPA